MTTPQPAALPELPEKLIFSERLAISEAAQVPMDAECCRVIQATLDYISSNYALAALQPAAAVSDEELLTAYNSIDPCNESPTDRLIRRLRATLALRPQAVPMMDAPVAYFSYGEDSGYLEHVTAEDASKHAREEITAYRSDAMHDNEWPSEVDSVCWGVVLQKATAVDNSEEAGRESFDYELGPHRGITQRADGAHQPAKEQGK